MPPTTDEKNVAAQAPGTDSTWPVKPMTEDELKDLQTNGVSLEELLQEIESLFPAGRSED